MAGSLGLNAAARRRATRPRCRGCGTPLHPIVAPAGYHVLCAPIPPAAYDRLILTPRQYAQLTGALDLEVAP
jgi:hypothetical protein